MSFYSDTAWMIHRPTSQSSIAFSRDDAGSDTLIDECDKTITIHISPCQQVGIAFLANMGIDKINIFHSNASVVIHIAEPANHKVK